jgi:DNA-binding transcriptional ArsR family regulator
MSTRRPDRGCDSQKAAELLRALAHPMRLQILCRLRDGELAVSGFETELGLKQPSLSQQLAALRDAELVATRREGKAIFYRLVDERVAPLLDALEHVLRQESGSRAGRSRTKRAPVPLPDTPVPPDENALATTQSGECGVFSVVGWPAQRGRAG